MNRTLISIGFIAGVGVALASPTTIATSDAERDGTNGPLATAPAQQIYVMTDKPLYRPGETVWFRAWEFDTALAAVDGAHGITVSLIDPRGSAVVSKRVEAAAGTAANDIALEAGLAGGRYIVRAVSDLGASEDHPITVSTYEVPRLKQSLEFGRRGYAPGDAVSAVLTVTRATGEVPRGATVSGRVVVDGTEVARPSATVGRSGVVTLRFTLPASIATGDGLLTAVVTDGGASESIQRRIPINTGVVAVAFYPEGGDLVAALASRVYFAATSPLGEPVDVSGRIVDDTGAEVGKFASAFRGRGTFALTPAAGRRYQAIVDQPATGGAPLALPEVHDRGCTLSVPDADKVSAGDFYVNASCSLEQTITVAATLRGKDVGRATVSKIGPSDPTPIHVVLTGGGQGAIRVTLVDGQGVPVAERLVYRRLGADLHVALVPDQDSYAPRAQVRLGIEARDAAGAPVATDVAVAVVDDSVLALADDHGARILARLYLEPEMPGQTIADPNFYFSGDKRAPLGLDLLLGTQGWRRFKH